MSIDNVSTYTEEWIKILRLNNQKEAFEFYCEKIIPSLMKYLQDDFVLRYNRESKYDCLVSVLGFTPETVIISHQFTQPDYFVVLHTKETSHLIEAVKKYINTSSNSYYEEFNENDPNDIYRAFESALRHFPKGVEIAIDLTGGKKTMGGALAVAAGILDIDQIYIDYTHYMPEFRKPRPDSTYIHLVENTVRFYSNALKFSDTDVQDQFTATRHRFGRFFSQMVLDREIERVIGQMTRSEKAQVLQWVARDLGDAFPGIDSDSEVCGGEARIVRTRIPVWLLVQARRLGASEADLLRNYPSLRAEDLTNAWAYARSHREEIEQHIRENEED
ncbi:MAG TPA: DUF433 domain-containing protein [Roseiflexaceae bacterium]|nr:DUF433 domain-containing protein [Roseiflexaceae bacterium]